ncbi:glycosyltransferase-like protein, family 2 [Candidatus Magnetomorum sp. HK-1]|nr:glycosyltransferase-like protein, family 2 [Candidatus Magnetomorum sp. HK-1]
MQKISVIIPVYNRPVFVKEAIQSVLDQTYPDVELIVVDDGSTDETAHVLNQFGNAIRVIHQQNQGVSAARNTGIHNSTGTWIAFLDSDDIWLPEKLTKQMQYVLATPNTLICQTEEIWIKNGKRLYPKKKHKKKSGMIFEHCLPLCIVSPSAVMIHKDLFKEYGSFDESLPACEDYDLWLRISCKYPIHLLDEPLIIKRGGHSDQLSQMIRLDRYRIQSILKILDSNVLTASQDLAAKKELERKCRIYKKGCIKHGRLAEAEELDEKLSFIFQLPLK